MYHFRQEQNSLEECEDRKCYVRTQLKWNGQENCTFGFICSRLEGNSCGDFGLELERDETDQVCHASKLHSLTLSTGDETKINLWYSGNFSSEIACYYWCTHDGRIPQKPESQKLDKNVLDDLVRKWLIPRKQNFNSNHFQLNTDKISSTLRVPSETTERNLKPDTVYHIRPAENFSCSEERCVSDQVLTWHDVASGCNASFVCSRLNGHPCGDYGISISYENRTDIMCQTGQVSTGYLSVGQTAHISVWHMANASSDWNCYFWCTPDIKTNDQCECGEPNKMDSANEQDELSVMEIPWQIQVLKEMNGGFEFICSGALLDKDTIITAAHCFAKCENDTPTIGEYKIVIGKSCLRDPTDNVLITAPREVHLHPDFEFQGEHPQFDVAIVKLENALEQMSHRARPVCLPMSMYEKLVDITGIVSGWGTELVDTDCGYAWYDNSTKTWLRPPPKVVHPHMLKRIEVLLLDDLAKQNSQEFSDVSDEVILGRVMNKQSSCEGDSGSPLMVQGGNGKMTLVGITSFGSGRCDPDDVIGFTKITSVLDWISGFLSRQCWHVLF